MSHKFTCPCCGHKTFDEPPGGTYFICPVCFWEDDNFQLKNPDSTGANKVSLRQAQKNFMDFGACERQMIGHVRKPTATEKRDDNWTPMK